MLSGMTWTQFVGWYVYYELEPFGEEREDLRIGFAFARLASMFTKSPLKPSDFIPEIKPPEDPLERWKRFKEDMKTLAQIPD